METPIYTALQKYINDNIYPFHMPGHKQGRALSIDDIMKIDITEVDGVDNLHNAKEVILESQRLTAKLFGAEETFYLVNGSSCGIIASILTVCSPNDKILVARNCHKSVYSGIIFAGVSPVYIMPEIIDDYNIAGGINVDKLKNIMNNSIKAVLITSPTYEGFCSDIKAIADIVHSYNSILIVDEAHGAHFKFNDYFPNTALEQGADIVIQSVHKTLPSLTQTALLHIQGNRVDIYKLKQMLSMVQTSSPSYILMSSIDLCKSIVATNDFSCFVNKLSTFRNKLRGLKALKLVDDEIKNKFSITQLDKSKIVIYSNSDDITGYELDKLLRQKYKLQIEMSGFNHIIAITTLADDDNGFNRLINALTEIDKELSPSNRKINCYNNINPIIKLLPRDAMFKTKALVKLEDSIGKIAGDFVVAYPPGIPIIAPGELITQNLVDLIIQYKENSLQIIGIDKAQNMIYTIE